MSYRVVYILLACVAVIKCADLRFSNVKCSIYDPSFAKFEKCELKVVGRGIVGMNILLKLLKVPVTNITLNLVLHRKTIVYKAFLYNISVDFCHFSRRRSKYPILKAVFDSFLKVSNINHSCPYDHDIILRNFVLKSEYFRMYPVPSGEYMYMARLAAYNKWKGDLKIYFYVK